MRPRGKRKVPVNEQRAIDERLRRYAEMRKYRVINLLTDEETEFDTMGEAQAAVAYDGLTHYQIWHNDVRIVNCDPYEGDDDRVAQALGQPGPWDTILV